MRGPEKESHVADPKTPVRPTIPQHEDAGFPPLRDIGHLPEDGGESDDDPERDFHEDGGGD